MIRKTNSRIQRSSQIRGSNLRKTKSKAWQKKQQSFEAEMRQDPSYYDYSDFCKKCNKDTYNVIYKKGGNKTWFFCSLFSLCGGLCLVPFYFGFCLDIQIYCSQCDKLKDVQPHQWQK